MSRILFCWELGGGLGHLYPLIPLYLELRNRGHEVLWAVPPGANAEDLRMQYGLSMLRAPRWERPPASLPLSVNYSDNLIRNGYGCAGGLEVRLKGWRALVDVCRPDLVVADHAPSALLAAMAMGVPRVAIGTGYCVPPLTRPMPGLQPWFDLPESLLAQKERKLLETVNPVLEQVGWAPLSSVADIFLGAESLLCTYPELDHYANRSGISYQGPIIHSAEGVKPLWPSDGRENVFLSMASYNRSFRPVIDMLGEMDLPVLAFIHGIADRDCHALERRNLRITCRPVDLRDVGNRCFLAVTHGGFNTSALMLLAGVPLLICPQQLEQTVLAHRIAGQGLCLMVNPYGPRPDLRSKMEAILSSEEIAGRVRALADRYATSTTRERVLRIVEKCAALAGSS